MVRVKALIHMRTKENLELTDQSAAHMFAPNKYFVEQSAGPRASKRGLSHDQVFEEALELCDTARDFRDNEVAEPEWNTFVYCPLLKLALRGYWWEQKGVWFYDIIIAAIGDPSLLSIKVSKVSLALPVRRQISYF